MITRTSINSTVLSNLLSCCKALVAANTPDSQAILCNHKHREYSSLTYSHGNFTFSNAELLTACRRYALQNELTGLYTFFTRRCNPA